MLKAEFVNIAGQTGGFYEVLPKKLTLNLVPGIFQSLSSRETCFKEVRRVLYKKPLWVTELQKELSSMPQRSGDWTKEVYEVIKAGIEKKWKPEKYHVIGASSGWDSRVMAKAIKELRDKNGFDWFGDTIFMECHGEAEPFKNIMSYLDLPYYVMDGHLGSEFYFQDRVKLQTHADKFNGMVSYPVNQWFDWTYKFHVKDCQYFTGYGSNEVDEMGLKKWHSFEAYHRWHYDLQLNWFKWPEDTVHVFWDADYLKSIWSYPEIRKHQERITELICRYQIPELNHIPRLNYENIPNYRNMSNWQMQKCITEYSESWFGSQVKCAPNPVHDYTQWWGYYCIASICEKLKGYKIV